MRTLQVPKQNVSQLETVFDKIKMLHEAFLSYRIQFQVVKHFAWVLVVFSYNFKLDSGAKNQN